MQAKKEILNIETLAMFERLINRDSQYYELDLMILPGTLEDKHKNCDSIPVLRRQFNLMYLLLDGEHDVKLGADHLQLIKNSLVIVPENMLYASDHIKNCKGFCIHFKTEFVQQHLGRTISEEFPFFHFDEPHIFNLNEYESQLIQTSFKNILIEYEGKSQEKKMLICYLLIILLVRVREIYSQHVADLRKNSTRHEHLAHQFKLLTEKYYIQKRTVNEYAEMLHITPKYLAEVVSETFGRSPLQIILDLLLLEAKMQLRATNQSVSEIAYNLQFEDPCHFTHFIKKRTGLSPQQLRKKQ